MRLVLSVSHANVAPEVYLPHLRLSKILCIQVINLLDNMKYCLAEWI